MEGNVAVARRLLGRRVYSQSKPRIQCLRGELVQWTRKTHQSNNAHKVLLGNCDLRCVGVLQAAWACHDAKVADLLQAAAAGEEPEQGDQGEQEHQLEQDNKNSQQVVRNLVSGFCSIVPNRAHGQGAAEGAQAQQGGEGGQGAPLAAGLAAEPPVVGGLGQQAEAQQEANPASASASASACHQRIESTMVAQRGTDRANIMDLMGFSDDEVAALQGGASDWDFDEDVEDEEDYSREMAEVEHEAGYSEELSDYDLSSLSDD